MYSVDINKACQNLTISSDTSMDIGTKFVKSRIQDPPTKKNQTTNDISILPNLLSGYKKFGIAFLSSPYPAPIIEPIIDRNKDKQNTIMMDLLTASSSWENLYFPFELFCITFVSCP